MFKCNKCRLILEEHDLNDGCCPVCNESVIKTCEDDVVGCNCGVVAGLKVCEICGEFICPECGCHSVVPISRITGYFSPVSEWAAGKRSELIDRVRYTV